MYRDLRLPQLKAALLVAVLAAGCGGEPAAERASLQVYAAASLRDVAVELGAAFERGHEATVEWNFAGSNVLAQQIRAAPRADVFLSADERWVDYLDREGRTVTGSRRAFLANRLVLVARADAELEVSVPNDLATAAYRYLALADPEAVPAGRYARGYLEQIRTDDGSLWDAVRDRVAPALDVRAALALVESDPEIVGVVYRTDALRSSRVRILYELPVAEALPIVYWACRLEGGASPELARRFLDFLAGAEADAIYRKHGFATGDG